ncbi:amino acid synthesis family protein [uncultured Roseobacter sp.]|uniref:amino acid synthesis family protein n=1 Tax=uncultured Roseobacter sp. TaxID=114847 RepID=UPI002619E035|nr:amino acid synthesis family protein [uncultured Roseobacter sp.]
MPEPTIRKTAYSVEEIFHEGGPAPAQSLKRASGMAVIENPFAGRYEPDIAWFMEDLKPLGLQIAQKLADLLGGAANVQGYGKGALVGEAGELEHGALWHVPGGYAMRELLDNSNAIVPSTKKVCGPGGRLDVPLTHINASYVRSHFDAMEVGLSDAPRAREMALVLVMSTGARIHDRVGGLAAKDIVGKDGLR